MQCADAQALIHRPVYSCLTVNKHFYTVCEPALYASAHIEITVRATTDEVDSDGEDDIFAEYDFSIENPYDSLLDCILASPRTASLAALVPSLAIVCQGGSMMEDATSSEPAFIERLSRLLQLLQYLRPIKFLFVVNASYITISASIAKALSVDRLANFAYRESTEDVHAEALFILLRRAHSTLTTLKLPMLVGTGTFDGPPHFPQLQDLALAGVYDDPAKQFVAAIIGQSPKLKRMSFPRGIRPSDVLHVQEVLDERKSDLTALIFRDLGVEANVVQSAPILDLRGLGSVRFLAVNYLYRPTLSTFPPNLSYLYIGQPVGCGISVMKQLVEMLEGGSWQKSLQTLRVCDMASMKGKQDLVELCGRLEAVCDERSIQLLSGYRRFE